MGRTPRLFPLRRCNIAARCPCVHAWDVPVSLPRPAPRQHRPGRAGGWRAGGLARDPYHLGRDEPAYRIVKKGARGLPESVSRDGSCRIPIDVVVAGDDLHSLAVSSFKR